MEDVSLRRLMKIQRLINIIGIAFLCLLYTGAKPLHYLLDTHHHAHHGCHHEGTDDHQEDHSKQSLTEHHDCQLCDWVLYSFIPPAVTPGHVEAKAAIRPCASVIAITDLYADQIAHDAGAGRAPPTLS